MSIKLHAKIRAWNKANEYAAKIDPELRKVFEPLVGQKILKADGSFMKKIGDLVPDLKNEPNLHVYRERNEYGLLWVVKASEMEDDTSCVYQSVTLYVGKVSDGILTEMLSKFEPEFYTLEGVMYNLGRVERAEEALREAKRNLGPFSPSDTWS